MHSLDCVTARLPTSGLRIRARRWAVAAVLALAAAAGAASAQYPNNAQGRQQAHAAEMNRLGWLQSQQAARYVSAEEIAAQQAADAAMARRDASVRHDQQRDWWGVVTVNTADGSWNVALNGEDKDATLAKAIGDCDGTCWPAVSFANTCMAPAYSAEGGMYWAAGEDKAGALEAATHKCAAAGGNDCATQAEQAICTGWKYAYSRLQRFRERVNLVAIGRVARPQVAFFPGAEEFIAKPPERRGESAPLDLGEGEAAGGRIAQAWSAIAVPRSGGLNAGMHLGVNRQDAIDTAMSKCGAPDCELLIAYTTGQCAAVVMSPVEGQERSFGAVGESKESTAQEAAAACASSGARQCLTMLNVCM